MNMLSFVCAFAILFISLQDPTEVIQRMLCLKFIWIALSHLSKFVLKAAIPTGLYPCVSFITKNGVTTCIDTKNTTRTTYEVY